jgi:S1-C subfamily serine protease
MIESILLTTTRVQTFQHGAALTGATGFFFERGTRLYLVTSRHVLIDEVSKHHPDMISIDLHVDPENVAHSVGFEIPLFRDGRANWRQGEDRGGEVDVAVVELDKSALPAPPVLRAFGPDDLIAPGQAPEVGAEALIPGFPLGFQDELHRLPVVRHAIIASSFGMRFQGQGFFLTDARTHRGSSGAPVVMRKPTAEQSAETLGWKLLGIHSSRLDMEPREAEVDEALGLNCAWYADILLTLTEG